jgi:hypothetical protein
MRRTAVVKMLTAGAVALAALAACGVSAPAEPRADSQLVLVIEEEAGTAPPASEDCPYAGV